MAYFVCFKLKEHLLYVTGDLPIYDDNPKGAIKACSDLPDKKLSTKTFVFLTFVTIFISSVLADAF